MTGPQPHVPTEERDYLHIAETGQKAPGRGRIQWVVATRGELIKLRAV